MLDTLETIELFGLTENGKDDLPMPDDTDLQEHAVGEAFEALIGTLQDTGLASEIEPLAHGFATMLHRRATNLSETADRLQVKLQALMRSSDGSEVAENEFATTQKSFEVTWEKAQAISQMAEYAAECYERETGDAYVPVTGNRTTKRAMETGAVFEAKMLLEAKDLEKAQRAKEMEGFRIAVSGSTDWVDVGPIFKRLDSALEKRPDMIICHKGPTA